MIKVGIGSNPAGGLQPHECPLPARRRTTLRAAGDDCTADTGPPLL